MTEIERQLRALGAGDHICLFYNDSADLARTLALEVKIGLERLEKCLYIVDDLAPDELLAALRSGGVDPDREMAAGRLEILTKAETFFRSGRFDPEEMRAFYQETTDAALAAGFSGARYLVEMTWALGAERLGGDRLVEHEAMVNGYFKAGTRALVICKYSLKRFPPELIEYMLRTHPLAILGNSVCPNLYYEPPEMVLGPDSKSEKVAWMISQLRDARAKDMAVRDSEARLRAILGNSLVAITLKDLQARYLLVNRRFESLFHVAADALIGRSDAEVFPAAIARALASGDRQLLQTGEPIESEEVIALPDREREFLVGKYPLIDSDGDVYAVCAIYNDVTESRRLERERKELALKELAARAEVAAVKELDRLKGSFLDTVSHELRTPLTSITGFTEILQDEVCGPLTARQSEFIDQVAKAAERLSRLVNDLLEIARMEAGTFTLKIEEGDFAERVREVVSSLQPQVQKARLALEVSVPAGELTIPMDAQRIGQVLTNLLDNAIKYTPEGGQIRVVSRFEGETIVCEVQDTGRGIPEADMTKLFRRFSQLAPHVPGKGTGLGLNIAKAIVEAHGGTMGVRSRVGAGTTFWFTLPLARRGMAVAGGQNLAAGRPDPEGIRRAREA